MWEWLQQLWASIVGLVVAVWNAGVSVVMAFWNAGVMFVTAFNEAFFGFPFVVIGWLKEGVYNVLEWAIMRFPEDGVMVALPDFPSLAHTPFGFVLGAMHILFDLSFIAEMAGYLFVLDNLILVIAIVRWAWGWLVG